MISANNSNKMQILLPPKTSDKKTLVLDLDETLVHSQFMTFSTPSDVIIKIEIENEIHDIHVMVRPGVKEFLEKMSKLYEIVIFTASVSKYADPLLDIIDKKGFCPFRLFREHCSLINTTFVKDLQRLGRDIKNIVIVDNSPLSYALHPENGLPILTWFEDKSDRELYQITPILEFLSYVKDVREFIPKFVGPGNGINYQKVNEIIKNYNGPKFVISDDKNYEKNKSNNNNYKNNGKEINKQKINNNDNYILKKNKNINNNKDNKDNKENIRDNKNKLIEIEMKNIIASVNPNSVGQNYKNLNNNPILTKKAYSKNRINPHNHKNTNNNEPENNKDSKIIKIDTPKSINVKTIINLNNTAHSTKKYKTHITDGNFKSKQKRNNYSTGGNYLKKGTISLNSDSKSIILKSDNNHTLNHSIKAKNVTPKVTKTINLLNKSNHPTTRSVNYTKKSNTYIITPKSNNTINNKLSKSLTKNAFNIKNNNTLNRDNAFHNNINNKNVFKNKYNSFLNIYNNRNNGWHNQNKLKSTKDFRTVQDNKNSQNNISHEKGKTNKKIEMIKSKNHFLKTGFIQNKMMNNKNNNINKSLSKNLSLSCKFDNSNNLNVNNINIYDYAKTNKEQNRIKYTLTNSNILKTNYVNNYSPNNRYIKKRITNNTLNNNKNNIQNHKLNQKINYKNYSAINDKVSIYNKYKDNNNLKIKNENNENNGQSGINRIKTERPKSSSIFKLENKTNNNFNHNISDIKNNNVKVKYQSKMKFGLNDILQKKGISGKINDFKKL